MSHSLNATTATSLAADSLRNEPALAQRSERCPDLGTEEFRLLPCCKVAAVIDLVKVDEIVITTL
jgi:hypothetical protein